MFEITNICKNKYKKRSKSEIDCLSEEEMKNSLENELSQLEKLKNEQEEEESVDEAE